MSALTRLALEVLQNQDAAPGLRQVACQTLLAAVEAAVEVPTGTHLGVWRYLLGSDASSVTLHRYELDHPEVARDAVRVLLDPDSGDSADLALAAIRGANISVIDDASLFAITDRLSDEGHVRRLTFLIERVHEHRGLSNEMIITLRDRLAGSELAVVRAAAVEVCGLLARLDDNFATRMLADSSPVVRAAVADVLERVTEPDRHRALVLLRGHLEHEQHRSVVSACLCSLSSIVRSGGRLVRQWEPPEN